MNSSRAAKLALVVFFAAMVLPPVAAAQSRTAPPPVKMQASWWDRTGPGTAFPPQQSRFYSIRADVDRDELREVASHLDTMYMEYSKRLASLQQRAPEVLNVLVFRDSADYVQTLSARFGVDATGSAGMFFRSPNGNALAFFIGGVPMARRYHVIQHEGFHQFAFSRFGDDLPMWLNEGLAEFFGEAVVVDGTAIIGQTTPWVLDGLKKAVDAEQTIPFRDLLLMSPQGWNARVRGGDAALQYQQSWAIVQFLVYGEGGRFQPAFERWLRLINSGVQQERAFVQAFESSDIDAFEHRWKSWLLEARPSSFVSALQSIEFLAEGALELGRRGIAVTSLDELRDKLREIGFTRTVKSHGYDRTLTADDDRVYIIPADDLTRDTPSFIVRAAKPARSTLKLRQLEERRMTPPSIETDKLKPRGIRIRWTRDEKTAEFSYEVDVR